MKQQLKNTLLHSLSVTCLLILLGNQTILVASEQWQDPFRFSQKQVESSPDSLNLAHVLNLVALANPTLKGGLKQIESAEGILTQAGHWPNPELEIEAEEVGWDASGFSESEITVSLSQEFELWGNRKNRKKVALRELEAVQLETQFTAFDIYTTTIERYNNLSHAQRRVTLANDAIDLAADMEESAKTRVKMGASMKSELLLGQLEMQKTELLLAEAISEMEIAQTELLALWQGDDSNIVIAQTGFDSAIIEKVNALESLLDGSREIRSLEVEDALTDAELDLNRSEAKPNLSLSGGYKRIEADGSNSFLIGVGLPLPLLNKNQGNIKSLTARKEALRFSRQQAIMTAKAEFETSRRRIEQQLSRYDMIETKALPKAEETYLSLKSAYEKGKLPYSTLLEAQRIFLEMRFNLNDIELAINQEVVTIERLLGVTIQ